jgi:transposase
LAKLKPTDIMAYEESLKVYRDLKAVTDTAYGDGYKEAAEKFGIEIVKERRQKEEAIKKQEEAIKKQEEAIKKQEEAIKLMVLNGISKETISATLGVSIDGIDQIMKS